MSWRESAACLGTFNPDFFSSLGGNQWTSVRRAKAICRTCPVTRECLDYSLQSRSYYGVWGGLTEKERRKVERKREAA